MIVRVFRARLQPGMRGPYEQLCREHALPLMCRHEGFLTYHIGLPRERRSDEFVLVTVWNDLDSVRTLVGEHWKEALILPGEGDMLLEACVQHFDGTYQGLVSMWHAVADVVQRREAAATAAPLTDEQWAQLSDVLPARNTAGRPRADDRRTLDGILYVLRSGCRWQDVPAEYGNGVTCWRRFRQWELDGTWERLWHTLQETLDTQGRLAWAQAVLDGRFIPTARTRRRSA
jgi:transposase